MHKDSISDNPSSLSLANFGSLFLITGISSTLALVIFLLPSIYKKMLSGKVGYWKEKLVLHCKLYLSLR